MIDILSKLHSIDYVYNDLKPDNICLGHFHEDAPTKIKLIDFGLCTKYKDKDGH